MSPIKNPLASNWLVFLSQVENTLASPTTLWFRLKLFTRIFASKMGCPSALNRVAFPVAIPPRLIPLSFKSPIMKSRSSLFITTETLSFRFLEAIPLIWINCLWLSKLKLRIRMVLSGFRLIWQGWIFQVESEIINCEGWIIRSAPRFPFSFLNRTIAPISPAFVICWLFCHPTWVPMVSFAAVAFIKMRSISSFVSSCARVVICNCCFGLSICNEIFSICCLFDFSIGMLPETSSLFDFSSINPFSVDTPSKA